MARLTKTEIYAIRWLNSQGKNIEQIAEELKLTDKQVQKTVEKTHISAKASTIKTATEKTQSKVKDLMINRTASKNINSVSVMTKEASEVADANKQNSSNVSISKAFKNSIYRPNSNK